MEAMQAGLPVICHDICGFGAVVDDTCGIKVPVKNPEESISGFAKAIDALHKDPAKLQLLSLGAMKKASENEWGRKAEVMNEHYYEAILLFSSDTNGFYGSAV
jgi:glycosyltransferase involved in cell wall biosynthesis